MAHVCTHNHTHEDQLTVYNQYDPTRTLTLRNRFSDKFSARMRELRGVLRETIIDRDCFGLISPDNQQANFSPSGRGEFAYPSDNEKIAYFLTWLKEQLQAGIIDRSGFVKITRDSWTNLYLRQAYERGVRQARKELSKQGIDVPEVDEIDVLLNTDPHKNNLDRLHQRMINELEGFVADISHRIGRVLSDSFSKDHSPYFILDRINKGLMQGEDREKFGLTLLFGKFVDFQRRADMIARSEVVRNVAEAALEEYELWGIEEVGLMAEWVTAGDNRVCFPKFVNVETLNGRKRISNVVVGDTVLSKNGYQKVIDTMQRNYVGKMTTVHYNEDFLFCTNDHPIWSNDRNDWIKAENLNLNESIKLLGNKFGQVRGVINFILSETNSIPTISFEGNISPFVFFRIMPVFPITLDNDIMFGNGKICQISSNRIFLNVRKIEGIKSESHFSFNGSFPIESSITSTRAKFVVVRRSVSKFFSTIFTFFNQWWSSTFFRTVVSIKTPSNIRLFMTKGLATIFTILSFPIFICTSTFKRTIIVPVSNRFFYSEGLTTSRADFIDSDSSSRIVTFSGTKSSMLLWSREWFSTLFAYFESVFSIIFGITSMRTKGMIGSRVFRSFALKRLFAVIADKIIKNMPRVDIAFKRAKFSFGRSGLKLFSTLITGDYRHISYDVIDSVSKYTNKNLKVYDITVEKEHSFFANGVLVHNCPICRTKSAQGPYKLSEAKGMIPAHVLCRCWWVPINPKKRGKNE